MFYYVWSMVSKGQEHSEFDVLCSQVSLIAMGNTVLFVSCKDVIFVYVLYANLNQN